MEITIEIDQAKVYEEVAQTTSYTGAKMTDDDPKAYERILTKDEDRPQLERFWGESCAAVCEELKTTLAEDEFIAERMCWRLGLNVSSAFDTALLPSIEKELFSFFVLNITAKWYAFTNKKEAADYGIGAASALESVHRKVCFKKRPKRPSFR